MIFESEASTWELKLKNMTVGFTLPLKNQDLSANTSSTTSTNNGTKPKELDVKGLILFEDIEHLKELRERAESVEDDGSRTIYTISEETAEAADIRQVIFDKNFRADKDEKHLAWMISFRLRQHKSVAEAVEGRQVGATPITDTSIGQVITDPSDDSQTVEANGWVYNLLKKLDNALGSTSETNETSPN